MSVNSARAGGLREDWIADPTGRTAIRNVLLGADDLIVTDSSGRPMFRIKAQTMLRLIPFIRFTLTRRGGGVRAHWAANDAIDDRKEIRPGAVMPAAESSGLRAMGLEAKRTVALSSGRALQGGLPGLGRQA